LVGGSISAVDEAAGQRRAEGDQVVQGGGLREGVQGRVKKKPYRAYNNDMHGIASAIERLDSE
jgi:hypothetical protein